MWWGEGEWRKGLRRQRDGIIYIILLWASQVCLPIQDTQGTWVQSLDGEDPLEKDMASPPCSGHGHYHPLQDSCLENPMGREAWRATSHGVTKSRT